MYPLKWVTIERAAELSGLGQDAIRNYIKIGQWQAGVEWKYNPVNRVMVNLEAMDKWQEKQPIAASRRGRRQSSSSSSSTDGVVRLCQ